MNWFLRHQSDIYSGAMLGTLIVTLVWELRAPVRAAANDQRQRWTLNFALMFVNLIIVYTIVPIASVTLAMKASGAGWGLLSRFEIGLLPSIVLSVLALDLGKYLQHYLLHRVPLLWRIHRTHHADPDCDVTTSFRFHPLELVVALLIEACVIVTVGVPAVAVVLYQAGRVALSTLVHGNVSFAPRVERLLRCVFVTPDLHRIHHSVDIHEQGSNLSGGLIWWDHIFRTYSAQPALDQRTMPLGLSGYAPGRANSLKQMLLDPLSARISGSE